MLALAFVRCPHAHAAVGAIDTAAALALPGVAAVLTAADLEAEPLSPGLTGQGFVPTAWPALAAAEVQYGGQAVAIVAAESASIAADARELVHVSYTSRRAIASIDDALAAGQLLVRRTGSHGEVDSVFAAAPLTFIETFTHGRCAAVPMEPRGVIADWDGDTLTLWASTQTPSMLRTALAGALGLTQSRVRVIVPDVGGGFGLKVHVFPEDVAVAAVARRLGRPVKWVEERQENLGAAVHAREGRVTVDVAADRTGRVRGLRARVISDGGAYHIYPLTAALEPFGAASILPGPYRIEAYAWEALAVRTHKPPLGAYRGVGMTMGAFVMERVLDLVAERVGLDPAEVRRQNLIPADAYPWTSPTGYVYDSGDYPRALEHALELADYATLRREQAAARAEGRLVGVGLACYTEYTGMGAEGFRRRGLTDLPGVEAATLTMDADGSVRCATSFPSQGQGHATTIAQVVADRLGVALQCVRVVPSDTSIAPVGSGTFASRGAVSIGGTVAVAADRVRERLQALAARQLEAAAADIVLADGRAHVRGFPERGIAVAELARLAAFPPRGGLPADLEPGLTATVSFNSPGPTFSGAVHVALVEIDRETGRVAVRRYVVVEDCGRVVNPMIVEGQIHGAVAQGLGEALLESIVYDADGQLLTGTLMDYALPRADEVPAFEIGHLQTPAPGMPGGVKGMGEGGTIGGPAALANAVADAVGPIGVRIVALPISAQIIAAGQS
jgi:carbon-monoxide dehydrogenase large subunit